MKEKRNKDDIIISYWKAFCSLIIMGFILFSVLIGGSAELGYQECGKFFVCNHDTVVEVSKTIWIISKVWGGFFWIFIPLTPLGAFVFSNIQKKLNQRKNRFE